MTPFGAFPGHGAFTLQGLNTRNHNGTEGRPQTTAAVAAAGDKKHGRPFKWIYTGGLDFTEDYLTEEVTDHKQRAKLSEALSSNELLSCLLGPEAPEPKQGEKALILGAGFLAKI